ncbi:MAG: CapA family protein [Lachnospiraceae bacterium]|nr:CapA family protein [Lachnospiraceae bacterium]
MIGKEGTYKNRKLNHLMITGAMAAVLCLTGCDRASGFIDTAMNDLGLSGKEESSSITIEKTDGSEQPVIVVNTDDGQGFTPVIEVVDEAGEDAAWDGELPAVEEDIYDDVNKIYSMHAASPDEMSLVFVGDICFHDGYSNMSALRDRSGGIFDCVLPSVMEGLKAADIFMANNEFPYSNRGTPTAGKQYAFRARPENVNLLHDMGVDIVSLANNHAYDHGPDALIDTCDILTEAKVPFVGAGKNLDEAVKPVYFRINGRTISYTAATQIERQSNPDTKEATADAPGVLRTLDPTRYLKVIEEAKANSDFCVAYVHWGSENTDLVEKSQKDLAKKYAAAGADLIIGDHSHCLQGFDYVDGVPVIYSLGNFWFNSKTVDTGYLRVILNNDCSIKTIQFVPCVQEGCKTRLAEGDKKTSILNYMQGISDYAAIDEEGYVTRSDKNHNIQNGQNTSPSRKKEEETPEEAPPASGLPLLPAPDTLPQVPEEVPQ